MASVIKIKRSSVQGKAPTTSDISSGEIALNTRDGKLFSSDGTVVFEIGANLHSLSVGTGGLSIGNGAITFPTSDGTTGQILKTYGNGTIYFADADAASSTNSYSYYIDHKYYTATTNTQTYSVTNPNDTVLNVYQNGIKLANSDYTRTPTTVTFDVPPSVGDIIELEALAIATRQNRAYRRFTFTANTNQTLFSGTDDFGQILNYAPQGSQVYLNGILLVGNTDYTETSSSQLTLTEVAANNDILSIESFSPVTIFTVSGGSLTANSYTSVSTSEQVVDTFTANSLRTAKYIIQITDNANSEYQSSEVLLIHNGSTVTLTEYGSIKTGNTILGTVDADVSGGSVRLKVTPTYSNSTIKTVRTAVVT